MLRLMSGVVAAKAMSRLMDSAVERAYEQRHPSRAKARTAGSALPAAAMGAGLMYLFDPTSGSARRTMLKEKITATLQRSGGKVSDTAHNVQAKSKDAVSKSISMVKNSTDEQLMNRVRSVIGEVSEKSSSIHVEVQNGRLIVSGPVDKSQVQRLRNALSRIPGLSAIDDRLEVRESQPH